MAGGSGAGKEASGDGFILHPDRAHPAFAGNDEPVIEVLDLVERRPFRQSFYRFRGVWQRWARCCKIAFSNPISVRGLFS